MGIKSVRRIRRVLFASLLAVAIFPGDAAPSPPARFSGGLKVVFGPDRLVSDRAPVPEGTYHRETSVAAWPAKHARVLVAGYMELYPTLTPERPCAFSVSDNKGTRWPIQGTVPTLGLPGLNACSDPSAAVDSEGTFYFASLEQNVPGVGQFGTDEIRVERGAGDGPWFQDPVAAVSEAPGDYLDKPYLVADAHADSPFAGTLYLTYTNIPFTGEKILVVVSHDGGRTWSAPTVLDGPPSYPFGLLGSVPVVGPDGTVYIFWVRYAYAGSFGIRVSRSSDGGETWSPPVTVVSNRQSPGSYYLKNADPMFGIAGYRGLQGNSFPSAAVTPDGDVFVAWTDFQNGTCEASTPSAPVPPCHNADVWLSVSRDAGATWSAPVKPTDEGDSSDQFFPWLAAHPDGLVSLAWLDRRLDPDNINYDVYYTNTFDGVEFLPNLRVTSVSSALGLTSAIGDYNGIAATAKEVVPVWGDLRDGDAVQVYGATGKLTGALGKDEP